MQGGDIQWPAGGTACNTRFTWICCPPPLSICAAFICPAFVVAFYQRICPRLHCGFVPFVSRICHHHLTGYIAREDFHLYYHLCQISPSVFSLQKNVNLTFGFNLNFAFEFRPLYKLINNRLKCPSPLQPISEIDIRFQCKHWASQHKCVLTFSRQEFCVKGDNNYG